MAFDGITTFAMVKELEKELLLGKIDKIYQPEQDQLVFVVHTKTGNKKLFASASSSSSRIHLIDQLPQNPPSPFAFCMLLRKHLGGGRITSICQKDSERIIEISLETLNELGFTVNKKVIFEIMGRHSNISLVDMSTGKIVDSIKRVSIDVSRVRQLLPGKEYSYPPSQDKIPFKEITQEHISKIKETQQTFLSTIGGIAPVMADQLSGKSSPYDHLESAIYDIENGHNISRVYMDEEGTPKDFYPVPLDNYEECYKVLEFDSLSQAVDYYYEHRNSTNRLKQKSSDLIHSVKSTLDKSLLKKQRLLEDIQKAENSDNLRLYGELLTANLHMVKTGAKSVDLLNYYDETTISIPLDERFSPSKNAQIYFKKYGKAKTSIKEKQIQLELVQADIDYLESVLSFLDRITQPEEIDAIRTELVETGFIKRRKTGYKEKKYKNNPKKITLENGMEVLIGKNNKENDYLTTKVADKTDIWFHTKDIPGSHVILRTGGINLDSIPSQIIYQVASIAAFHSKGRESANVPVDYVLAKNVKKPSGAKPGMVIFTSNKTVWVDPKETI